jgi:hypothetical protein
LVGKPPLEVALPEREKVVYRRRIAAGWAAKGIPPMVVALVVARTRFVQGQSSSRLREGDSR